MTVRIDIDTMRRICAQVADADWQANEWRPAWAASTPEQRRNALDQFVGAWGAACATAPDINSMVAPELFWPPGHSCLVQLGATGAGGGGAVGPTPGEELADAIRNGYAGGAGSSPLPGLGVLRGLPDWLKWLALAGIGIGLALVIRRNKRG